MCRLWISAPVRPPLGRRTSSGHAPAVQTSQYYLYQGATLPLVYTSAAEVRDRLRPAHGAFYATISLLGQVYLTRVGKGLRTQRRDPAATSTCTNYIARRLYSIHNRRHDRPASRVTHILARLRRRTKLRPSTWPTSRFCTSILNTEVPFATMLHVH